MGPAPLIGNKMAAAQIGSAFSRIKSAPRQIRYVREILSARNRREHVNLVAILKTRTKFNARSIAENGKVSPDAWSFVAEPAFHNGPSSIKGGDQACDRIRRYSDLRLRFRKKRKESPWKNNLDLGTLPLCAIKFCLLRSWLKDECFYREIGGKLSVTHVQLSPSSALT